MSKELLNQVLIQWAVVVFAGQVYGYSRWCVLPLRFHRRRLRRKPLLLGPYIRGPRGGLSQSSAGDRNFKGKFIV